jgi:bifunctional DNase/RNase
MKKVSVRGVVSDKASGRFLLLLAGDDGRMTVVPVGLVEGRAIVLRLKQSGFSTPLVYDFIRAFADDLGVEAVRVELSGDPRTECAGRFFYRAAGRAGSIECRPGDAAALAQAFGVPLLAGEELFARPAAAVQRENRARPDELQGPLTEREALELHREIEELSAEEFWRKVRP